MLLHAWINKSSIAARTLAILILFLAGPVVASATVVSLEITGHATTVDAPLQPTYSRGDPVFLRVVYDAATTAPEQPCSGCGLRFVGAIIELQMWVGDDFLFLDEGLPGRTNELRVADSIPSDEFGMHLLNINGPSIEGLGPVRLGLNVWDTSGNLWDSAELPTSMPGAEFYGRNYRFFLDYSDAEAQAARRANFVMDTFVLQPYSVPEPTSLALLGLGLVGIALRRRKVA